LAGRRIAQAIGRLSRPDRDRPKGGVGAALGRGTAWATDRKVGADVPSYYVARPSANLVQAARQAATRSWWDGGCSGLDLYTSTEALDEAGRGDSQMAAARIHLLRSLEAGLRW